MRPAEVVVDAVLPVLRCWSVDRRSRAVICELDNAKIHISEIQEGDWFGGKITEQCVPFKNTLASMGASGSSASGTLYTYAVRKTVSKCIKK